MTQKELLYLEDAVEHEKNLIKIANETVNLLMDDELKNFINWQLEIHQQVKMELMNLLRGMAK